MNKSVILNCKNFKCNRFDKGDCRLSHVSFAPVGGAKDDRMICEDFEEKPDKDDTRELKE